MVNLQAPLRTGAASPGAEISPEAQRFTLIRKMLADIGGSV